MNKPEGIFVVLSRIGALYYFAHFLVILPLLGKLERPLPLPESISQPVTGGRGGGPMPSGAAAKPMEKA
jgi:ubiquinol-cytochrome c reductase cytochrome b subunit